MTLAFPATLTPSKLAAFTACPLAFRYAVLEGLRLPPNPDQLRGILVHRALQRLFGDLDGAARTRAAADKALELAAEEVLDDPEAAAALESRPRQQLLEDGRALLARYFALEDPRAVRTIGIELHLRGDLDGVPLHGVLDRLDRGPDGALTVVDYKTGRAPRPGRTGPQLAGVELYAYLCEASLGARPAAVRLLYLGDGTEVRSVPTDQRVEAAKRRILALAQAIRRACETDDFRPRVSPLCRWCGFRPACPAFASSSLVAAPASERLPT